MKRYVLGVVILALSIVPVAVMAQKVFMEDPRDTPGLLDVQRVKMSGLDRPTFKTITFKRWTAKRIWDRGYAIIHLDARGDSHFEYYILARSVDSRMQGTLFRDRRSKPDYVVGGVDVWRSDRRSVSVRVKLARLNMPVERTYYRWYVKTLMTGSSCPATCIDRAPDEGALQQFVVDPSQEPSPPVTPAPDPTFTPSPEPTATPPDPEPTDAP